MYSLTVTTPPVGVLNMIANNNNNKFEGSWKCFPSVSVPVQMYSLACYGCYTQRTKMITGGNVSRNYDIVL